MTRIKTARKADNSAARFGFGENWRDFLAVIDEERIVQAQAALAEMLGTDNLGGMAFLDIGSGSGLSSLAAMRMGADRVHSFDYDAESVASTAELRRRYFPNSDNWIVEKGDAIEPSYMDSLGTFDVVYSWGVLHHTGAMWSGIDLACEVVAPTGRLFLAIYNDQGWQSRLWLRVKRFYVDGSQGRRRALVMACGLYFALRSLARAVISGDKNALVGARSGRRERGMSSRHDLVDWVGGYPFEVARPEEIFDFCKTRGFELSALQTAGGGLGCNQFVFTRR